MREIFPAPRTFWWLPVTGQRHAIRADDRATPTGAPLHSLCEETFERPAPPTDAEWLWSTCEQCWIEACKAVGVGHH